MYTIFHDSLKYCEFVSLKQCRHLQPTFLLCPDKLALALALALTRRWLSRPLSNIAPWKEASRRQHIGTAWGVATRGTQRRRDWRLTEDGADNGSSRVDGVASTII
jgi:hypothetical protein